MKKSLREVVLRRFKRGMAEGFPSFSISSERVPKNDLAYSYQPLPNLVLFVILEINPDWDAFTVSLAWNERSSELPRILGMNPSDAPFNGQLRFPLSRLWSEQSMQDPWHWKVNTPPKIEDSAAWIAAAPPESELLLRAERAVEDALQQLMTSGTTYFSRIVAAHEFGPSGG